MLCVLWFSDVVITVRHAVTITAYTCVCMPLNTLICVPHNIMLIDSQNSTHNYLVTTKKLTTNKRNSDLSHFLYSILVPIPISHLQCTWPMVSETISDVH
jgi:hypothetical protein